MGCKDFTQRSQEKIEESNDAKEKIVIKSKLLQQFHKAVITPNFLCSKNYFPNRECLQTLKSVYYFFQGEYIVG